MVRTLALGARGREFESLHLDTMIDDKIWEKQAKLIFSIIVAGKNAEFAYKKVRELLADSDLEYPFEYLDYLTKTEQLEEKLRTVKTGNYRKLTKAFPCLLGLDVDTCTTDELEKIPGIGPKTSRFFMLWTRSDANVAALDVHILHWLRDIGYNAPKTTPPAGKVYSYWEQIFLEEAKKKGLTAAQLDTIIWEAYSEKEMPNFEITRV